MKILHTSDWHLGIGLHNITLLDDQRHIINNILEIASDEKPGAIVIAGDVFDTSVAGAQTIELYNYAVTQICKELKIPLLIIAGNHDGAARLSCAGELLKGAGLYVSGRVEREIKPIIIENTAFYLIPFFNTDEIRALFPDDEIKSTEQAMARLCQEIGKGMDKSLVNIAVAHAFVSGAETSESDRSAVIGAASMISSDVFSGFDYVMLGHLHREQVIKNARYSGTPLKYSAAEAKGEKCVLIYDTVKKEISRRELSPVRGLRVLRGGYAELMQTAAYSEDFIKLEITDKFATLDIVGAFKSFYPNLFSVTGQDAGGEIMQISLEDVNTMTSEQLMTRFFDEAFGYSPTKAQVKLFEDAVEQAGKETDGE